MPSAPQRIVLVAAAIAGTAAFLFQPKLGVLGEPLGYFPFFQANTVPLPSYGEALTPDYRQIATEYAALVFVAACAYASLSRGIERTKGHERAASPSA